MKKDDLCSKIKETLLDEGASLVGFADLSEVPENVRDSKRFAVSIAVALAPSIIANIRNGPTKEYYSEYRKANDLLWELGKFTSKIIEDRGYKAIPKAPTNVGIDPRTHSTILPHKTVATRAGLGWIGKCALLVTEKYGSAVRITTVLTDAPLETGAPIVDSQCGDCMECVDFCPGKAPSGKNWNFKLQRDFFFDAFACAKAARERANRNINLDDTICGICISVCPWTIKYIQDQGFFQNEIKFR